MVSRDMKDECEHVWMVTDWTLGVTDWEPGDTNIPDEMYAKGYTCSKCLKEYDPNHD